MVMEKAALHHSRLWYGSKAQPGKARQDKSVNAENFRVEGRQYLRPFQQRVQPPTSIMAQLTLNEMKVSLICNYSTSSMTGNGVGYHPLLWETRQSSLYSWNPIPSSLSPPALPLTAIIPAFHYYQRDRKTNLDTFLASQKHWWKRSWLWYFKTIFLVLVN